MPLYPPVGFHFRVEFGLSGLSSNDSRFQEVSGLQAELGVEEVVEGGENRFTHRLPSRGKYGNLVLKRGLLADSTIADWARRALENFEFEPTDVLVTLLNEKHEPLSSWSFSRAWPLRWRLSDLKAQENAIAIESLELAYAYFTSV